eukprot:CAMPEP_0203946446 /NCGR_PEP_ID=MMETSP0359-20131031/81710_1 /ASSEMBLY_ACC=CAM_ASM_000338 /TAXON_ID=268821 /ORGANISM="Scrippsiella Hangoei, Strain SHTV-5" /LENGTH=63 /DNA_ID=CAMNT_0050877755 /DNA_START=212 /DNA_END=403 /DNA_ORIENTATION=+
MASLPRSASLSSPSGEAHGSSESGKQVDTVFVDTARRRAGSSSTEESFEMGKPPSSVRAPATK